MSVCIIVYISSRSALSRLCINPVFFSWSPLAGVPVNPSKKNLPHFPPSSFSPRDPHRGLIEGARRPPSPLPLPAPTKRAAPALMRREGRRRRHLRAPFDPLIYRPGADTGAVRCALRPSSPPPPGNWCARELCRPWGWWGRGWGGRLRCGVGRGILMEPCKHILTGRRVRGRGGAGAPPPANRILRVTASTDSCASGHHSSLDARHHTRP